MIPHRHDGMIAFVHAQAQVLNMHEVKNQYGCSSQKLFKQMAEGWMAVCDQNYSMSVSWNVINMIGHTDNI